MQPISEEEEEFSQISLSTDDTIPLKEKTRSKAIDIERGSQDNQSKPKISKIIKEK